MVAASPDLDGLPHACAPSRGDDTQVHFFTREHIRELMISAGLVEVQNRFDNRLLVNRARQVKMQRVWLQCKYQKPHTATASPDED
eukprot:m.852556 g.852556  ORF g.852556 m.852556 type:complete len:86 (+) comp23496_c0_seq17:1730-1987(+)